tara:strand:+ start:131 stop:619 length:489 start_codon:yes stop_codon:yes gene_type:complete
MELSQLIKQINTFNNSALNEGKNEYLSNKEYRGNQHDLDSYLNTIRYMEYQKSVRKNVRQTKVISEENTFSDFNSIQEHLEKNQFKTRWSRLDSYLKTKKLEEYVKKNITDNKIKETDYTKFITLLKCKLHAKELNKKNEVTYDEENGIILKIPYLDKLIDN